MQLHIPVLSLLIYIISSIITHVNFPAPLLYLETEELIIRRILKTFLDIFLHFSGNGFRVGVLVDENSDTVIQLYSLAFYVRPQTDIFTSFGEHSQVQYFEERCFKRRDCLDWFICMVSLILQKSKHGTVTHTLTGL